LSDLQILNVNEINSRSKIRDRIEKIKEFSGVLNFTQTESSVFGNNLALIDSGLPEIIAAMVYMFYTSGFTRTTDLVNEISRLNPLGFNFEANHPFYSYKIKRLLTDIALGMMPSKVW